MTALAIGGLGTPELLIILAVIILIFGANKLPELARGSGRALRIFKAETKGLMDDDKDVPSSVQTPEEKEIQARQAQPESPLDTTAQSDAERRGDTTS